MQKDHWDIGIRRLIGSSLGKLNVGALSNPETTCHFKFSVKYDKAPRDKLIQKILVYLRSNSK